MCKHIKTKSECGSSSLTICVEYSSSVCGNLTDFTGILISFPPQTEVYFEEEQQIYLVSMLPFTGGSLRKSGADWKTKQDSARVSYSTGKVWKVRGWCSGELFTPQLHSCRPPTPYESLNGLKMPTGINTGCTGATLPSYYCVPP